MFTSQRPGSYPAARAPSYARLPINSKRTLDKIVAACTCNVQEPAGRVDLDLYKAPASNGLRAASGEQSCRLDTDLRLSLAGTALLLNAERVYRLPTANAMSGGTANCSRT